MEKVKSAFCRTCDDQRRFVARRPRGTLHTFLTVISCGIWLFIWPIFYAASTRYRCTVCGAAL